MKKADKILIVCIMIVAVVLCVPLFFSKNEFGEDISKSGMKHRLAKVKQMASELKEELDA